MDGEPGCEIAGLTRAVLAVAGAEDGIDDEAFARILAAAARDLVGCTDAGVSLHIRTEQQAVVASTDQPRMLNVLASAGSDGLGPNDQGLEESFASVDVAREPLPWPGFGAAAAQSGYISAYVTPLRRGTLTFGAVILLDDNVWSPSLQVRSALRSLAAVAGVVLAQSRLQTDKDRTITQLRQALDERVSIEQAKGVLAERYGVSIDEAFALVRGYARNHNLRLHALAQAVVDGSADLGDATALPPE